MLKMQTSMFLILGSLVSFLGWFFIYPGGDGPDATAAENAANLMANPGAAKVGMLMGSSENYVLTDKEEIVD